jgi:hypothetical protein
VHGWYFLRSASARFYQIAAYRELSFFGPAGNIMIF